MCVRECVCDWNEELTKFCENLTLRDIKFCAGPGDFNGASHLHLRGRHASTDLILFALQLFDWLVSVGHCHPHVVGCGQEQMARLSTSNGFLSDQMALYTKRLTETLPDKLCVCYLVNSG